MSLSSCPHVLVIIFQLRWSRQAAKPFVPYAVIKNSSINHFPNIATEITVNYPDMYISTWTHLMPFHSCIYSPRNKLADPGFPRWGGQPLRWGHQPIILDFWAHKLEEFFFLKLDQKGSGRH